MKTLTVYQLEFKSSETQILTFSNAKLFEFYMYTKPPILTVTVNIFSFKRHHKMHSQINCDLQVACRTLNFLESFQNLFLGGGRGIFTSAF